MATAILTRLLNLHFGNFFFFFPSRIHLSWDNYSPPFYFDDSKRMTASLDDLSFMLA